MSSKKKDQNVVSLENEKDNRTIFRKAHNRENPYALISKTVLKDRRLSAKAMGIMCYLLSLPDDWEICITELVSHFSDGIKSIRAGIKELVLLGYLGQADFISQALLSYCLGQTFNADSTFSQDN